MHQALYRKYRPFEFESVVGQDSIIKTLKNSIISQKIGHAYMFFGPRGTGKTTVSKIFARSINCSNPIDGISCGECENCKHSYEKECVDILELDAASNNGVDEIRDLINNISLVPSYLKYKVYIIDEVHMLSIGAFNALLKTLEEPPEHAIFILATTDPQKVPETIISRCQCYSFKRISNEMIIKRLKEVVESENINIDDDVLEQIAISSNGGMRDSLVMLDQLSSFSNDKIDMNVFSELNGTITNNDVELFISNILNHNVSEIINSINDYNNRGKNIILIINQIINYLRNYIVDCYISNKVSDDLLKRVELINFLNEKMIDIKKSDNPKIYIEILLIKFISDNQNSDKININSVVDKNISVNNNILSSNNVLSNSTISSKDSSKSENLVEEEEEFSFDDYMDNEYDDESNFSNNVAENKTTGVVQNNIKPKLLNFNEINDVRINNVFVKATKKDLLDFSKKLDLFRDYLYDDECGFIANLVIDSIPCVASDSCVLLGFKYNSSLDQLIENYESLNDVFSKVLKSNYSVAIINYDSWDKYKNEFIKNKSNGIKPEIKEEPLPVYEEIKNNDIISNSAMDLFGDIVEYN